jgi:hypothetical protein
MKKPTPYLVLLATLFIVNQATAQKVELNIDNQTMLSYALAQSSQTGNMENSTPTLNVGQGNHFTAIKKGRNMGIIGTALFFSGVALEWSVLYPMAQEVKEENDKYGDTDSIDVIDNLKVFALSIVVATMKISGPLTTCIGAHKSKRALRLAGFTKERKTHVWKPYIIGCALGGTAFLLNVIGMTNEDQTTLDVGTGFSIGQDVAWSVATIWALVETVKNYKAFSASNNTGGADVSVVPYATLDGGGGVAFSCNF